MKVDFNLENSNKMICDNIDDIKLLGRWKSSVHILKWLRDLVDSIIIKIKNSGNNVDMTNEEIKQSVKFIKENAKYRELRDFHQLLQISSSHYTNDEFCSETLIIKYLEYLYKIRKFAKDEFNIEVLNNLEDFPSDLDELSKNYYRQIAEKIELTSIENTKKDIYYIIKKKTIILEWNIFYEITFTWLNNKNNKSDRFIGFTKIDIFDNYAVKLYFTKDNINIFGKEIQIFLIKSYEVSIRPDAELSNFAKILWFNNLKIRRGDINYNTMMKFIKEYWLSLVDIIWNDVIYNIIKSQIRKDLQSWIILNVFEKTKTFINSNRYWSNVIKYLLFNLNHRIIVDQYSENPCNLLSNLYLSIYSKPFDKTPFTFSLVLHNPRLLDLMKCIDYENREDELFARYIKNNAETNWHLYTKIEDVEQRFNDIDNLINTYFSKLRTGHKKEWVVKNGKHLYIKSYENNVIDIIKKINELSWEGLQNYSNFIDKRLEELNFNIDDSNKEDTLKKLFLNSKVALIYWSAGTWKTKLIEYISDLFSNYNKLYVTQTHTALNNLERRIKFEKKNFITVNQATKNTYKCDILFVDESSTISNRNMEKILCKWDIEYEYLVVVWDTYQIESIQFGNWFSVAENLFSKFAYHLDDTHRTKDKSLLNLWNKTRKLDNDLIEYISQEGYWCKLDDDIFKKYSDDEVILCLNYDWIYWVNSINNYMQINNENDWVELRDKIYKIWDPIVFNDLANNHNRFWYTIYNNLKWNIFNIKDEWNYIDFYIWLKIALTSLDIWWTIDLTNLESEDFVSIIKFPVHKKKQTIWEDEDEEISEMHIVPFDIAYAMSIHKAQWLEYNSVKIIITDEIEEKIKHNIFYTAITRTKEKLKIYSSPEVLNRIISKMTINNSQDDTNIIRNKLK